MLRGGLSPIEFLRRSWTDPIETELINRAIQRSGDLHKDELLYLAHEIAKASGHAK